LSEKRGKIFRPVFLIQNDGHCIGMGSGHTDALVEARAREGVPVGGEMDGEDLALGWREINCGIPRGTENCCQT